MIQCTVRPVEAGDRPNVERILTDSWGSVSVYAVAIGGLVDASTLPGLVAEVAGDTVGLLTYRRHAGRVDIVTINALRPAAGIGTALIEALIERIDDPATELVVATTNDNTDALRFYQRAGFRLSAVRLGAVEEARKHKPGIPPTGRHGIPIRDELELVRPLRREPPAP